MKIKVIWIFYIILIIVNLFLLLKNKNLLSINKILLFLYHVNIKIIKYYNFKILF